MKKYFVFAMILIAFLVISYGCTKKDDTIKVGVIAPFTGPNAHIGTLIKNATNLYFDDLNKSGGINGKQIKLVFGDDASSPEQAVKAVQQLVEDKNVIALIAHYNSSCALATKQLVAEAQIPLITYSASNVEVTLNNKWVFRDVPTDASQAIALANFAQKLGARSAVILFFNDDYGKGLADGIKKRAMEIKLPIIAEQSYDQGTTNFRPQISVLKSKKPDVTFICGFVQESQAIILQARESEFKTTFLCGDGTFNVKLIENAGSSAEGVYVASPLVYNENDPTVKTFLDKYRNKFNSPGDLTLPDAWGSFAYDCCGVVTVAVKAVGPDRSKIRDYWESMNTKEKAYSGVTGLTWFDKNGDSAERLFMLALVKDKQFVKVPI
jgi:branched-chain amino acid transport system substrate-binding protein